MSSVHAAVVRRKDGWCGTVVSTVSHKPSDSEHVLVQLENGERLLVPTAVMSRQPDGSYDVPLRLAELASSQNEARSDTSDTLVMPVIAEELTVDKRVVETDKVRITKTLHEREEVVD